MNQSWSHMGTWSTKIFKRRLGLKMTHVNILTQEQTNRVHHSNLRLAHKIQITEKPSALLCFTVIIKRKSFRFWHYTKITRSIYTKSCSQYKLWYANCFVSAALFPHTSPVLARYFRGVPRPFLRKRFCGQHIRCSRYVLQNLPFSNTLSRIFARPK